MIHSSFPTVNIYRLRGYQESSLYKNVIDDVIRNIKEAFNDEGVDETIIKELKELWEQKLTATKAIEPDERAGGHGINQRATNYQYGMPMGTRNVGAVVQGSNFVQRTPAVRFMDGLPVVLGGATGPSTSAAHQATFTLPVSIPAGTQNLSTTTAVGRQQPQLQQQIRYLILPQMGASTAANSVIVSSRGGSSAAIVRPQVMTRDNSAQVQQHLTQQAANANPKSNTNNIVQLDGPPDANISEDDDEDFDNIEEDAANDVDEDEETNFVEDVEPLNSDDDDLINENADELFEADDIIVCQYENIVRTRSKWKLLLKDGIMNLSGKDYVFNKASGETEF